MTYAARTATTADPIALTFAKIIDYPSIFEDQFGSGSTPIFVNGQTSEFSLEPDSLYANKPCLFVTAFDSSSGSPPGSFTGTYTYGISHADYAIRQAGTNPAFSSEYYEKQAYIDGMALGIVQNLTPTGEIDILGENLYDPTVGLTFERQVIGDFTGGIAAAVSPTSEETGTSTFEAKVTAMQIVNICPSLASTADAPEALVVFDITYDPDAGMPIDRYGAFKIGPTGAISLVGLFRSGYDISAGDTILAHTRDDTHHYFIHQVTQDPDDKSTWGTIHIAQEAAWGTFNAASYTCYFDDPDLPPSLGELVLETDPTNYKFTAIYGTDAGFLISYKKKVTGTWTPKWVLVSKDWTTLRHINATAGDATATTILTQGQGNDQFLNAISMIVDGSYAWMIGGDPTTPLIVESPFTAPGSDSGGTEVTNTTNAWPFRLDGHRFYVLPQVGVVYDLTTNQCMEWMNEGLTRLRAVVGQNWAGMTGTLSTFNTDIVAGDESTGVLWIFDPTTKRDDRTDGGSEAFTRIVTSMVHANGRETIKCNAVQLICSLGDPSQTGASITLETSDDRGNSWLNHGSVEIVAGDHEQVIEWRGLGVIREPGRIFRFTDDGATVNYLRAEMR